MSPFRFLGRRNARAGRGMKGPLLDRARAFIDPDDEPTPESRIILELCEALESERERAADNAREAYREGVRSAARVIEEKRRSLAEAGGDRRAVDAYDAVADGMHDLAAADVDAVLLDALARALAAAAEPDDELDRAVLRTTSAVLDRRRVGAGPPLVGATGSLERAVAIVEAVAPDGWWTVGSEADGGASALVGLDEDHDPPPSQAATPALALLAALFSALAVRGWT